MSIKTYNNSKAMLYSNILYAFDIKVALIFVQKLCFYHSKA